MTAVDVIERRDKLASGRRSPEASVRPEPAHDEHAGRLVLLVLDEPMSDARPAAWPLARDGQADLSKPADSLPSGATAHRGPAAERPHRRYEVFSSVGHRSPPGPMSI